MHKRDLLPHTNYDEAGWEQWFLAQERLHSMVIREMTAKDVNALNAGTPQFLSKICSEECRARDAIYWKFNRALPT